MTKTNAQTAVKTRAAKAAKSAKPAKAAVDKDAIVQSSGGKDGDTHYVKSLGGGSFSFPTAQWTGEIRAACAIGKSFKAAKAAVDKLPKEPVAKAQLARGIAAKDAQHSAKAVADQSKGKASNKADAVTQKPKAAKVAKAAKPGRGADRAYTVVNKDHGARPESKRALQLEIVFKHKSTAAARAAGAESCDFSFAEAKGFIKFA